MQPFKEVLNTDAEFKAACMAHGEHTLAILDYIRKQNEHTTIYSDQSDSEKVISIKKLRNLAEIIQEIDNARKPTAPDFN